MCVVCFGVSGLRRSNDDDCVCGLWLLQNCIEQEFDFPGLVEVRSNDIFEKEFFWNIKGVYTRMTSRSGTVVVAVIVVCGFFCPIAAAWIGGIQHNGGYRRCQL